jgi:cell shape-determining protein MreD
MIKTLRLLGIILFAYIAQTTILPRVAPLMVRPDLVLAVLVALTVDGDRYLGFCAGATIGLLLDTMVGWLPFLYLIAYPLIGYFSARLTPWLVRRMPMPRRLEALLTPKRFRRVAPMLTALVLALFYELALMVYRYLNGVDVTFGAVSMVLRSALYTGLAVFPAQFYVRLWMRAFRRRKRRAKHV